MFSCESHNACKLKQSVLQVNAKLCKTPFGLTKMFKFKHPVELSMC